VNVLISHSQTASIQPNYWPVNVDRRRHRFCLFCNPNPIDSQNEIESHIKTIYIYMALSKKKKSLSLSLTLLIRIHSLSLSLSVNKWRNV